MFWHEKHVAPSYLAHNRKRVLNEKMIECVYLAVFSFVLQKGWIPYGDKIKTGVTFHDIRSTVKTNMLKAGIDKIYRDVILGHSLNGMDAFYMFPSDNDLKGVMNRYTEWFDNEMKLEFVDQTVDQTL